VASAPGVSRYDRRVPGLRLDHATDDVRLTESVPGADAPTSSPTAIRHVRVCPVACRQVVIRHACPQHLPRAGADIVTYTQVGMGVGSSVMAHSSALRLIALRALQTGLLESQIQRSSISWVWSPGSVSSAAAPSSADDGDEVGPWTPGRRDAVCRLRAISSRSPSCCHSGWPVLLPQTIEQEPSCQESPSIALKTESPSLSRPSTAPQLCR